MRAYTRKQFTPLVALAALGFGVAMVVAGPLLHLLYSERFDGARPMLGWTMVGEFGKVVVMTWSLGALRTGGVRLWVPIGASWATGIVISYVIARIAGAGVMALPYGYAGAGLLSVAWTALLMTRRGVSLDRRAVALIVLAGLALAALAAFTGARVPRS